MQILPIWASSDDAANFYQFELIYKLTRSPDYQVYQLSIYRRRSLLDYEELVASVWLWIGKIINSAFFIIG